MKIRILFYAVIGLTITACNLPVQPDYTGPFAEGYAPVMKFGRWGMMDSSGKLVLDYKYDSILCFTQGLAAFQSGAKWGYLGKDFSPALPAVWDSARPFYNGLAMVYSDEKYTFCLINREGEIVLRDFLNPREAACFIFVEKKVPDLYDHYGIVFKNHSAKPYLMGLSSVSSTGTDSCALFCDSTGWYVISASGRTMAGAFDDVRLTTCRNVIITGSNKKYRLFGLSTPVENGAYDDMGTFTLDTNLREKDFTPDDVVFGIITLGLYPFMRHSSKEEEIVRNYNSFSEGLMPVKKNGLYGYIDTNGRLVIPCRFQEAGDFKGGRAGVKAGGVRMTIGNDGKVAPKKPNS